MRIITSKDNKKLNETFQLWIKDQWGTKALREDLPSSLLLVSGDQLLGGLNFTFYKHPSMDKEALWIDAVLIAQMHRRKGYGSLLINAAQDMMSESYDSLFVYTDVEGLYLDLGWHVVKKYSDHVVLKKEI